MQVTISRSKKKRQGARYLRDGKELDRNPRQWEMVVEKMPAGKNKKGKAIYHSYTAHIPA